RIVENFLGLATDALIAFPFGAYYREVNIGIAQIFGDLNVVEGHHTETRIFHLKLDHLRQIPLRLVTQTRGTAVFFWHCLLPGPGPRSEERRVGKECRSRRGAYH